MTFDLIVFAAEPARARDALAAGASAVIVDWEVSKQRVSAERGTDTEINRFGAAELGAVRRSVDGHVVCACQWHARELPRTRNRRGPCPAGWLRRSFCPWCGASMRLNN